MLQFVNEEANLKMQTFLGIAVFIVLVSFCCWAEIPGYIEVCRANDPNLSACITRSIEKLRGKLRTGIPELNASSFEPMDIGDVEIKRGRQGALVEANITSIKVYGVSEFQISNLTFDLPTHTFFFKVLLPRLYFTGKYKSEFQILFLQVRGRGPIVGNITNYAFRAKLSGKIIVGEDGREYLKFEEMKLAVKIEKIQFHVDDLFGEDHTLNEIANTVLNDSADVILEEIKPSLERSVAAKCLDIANKISLKFPFSELSP